MLNLLGRLNGVYTQLPLLETPPKVRLKEEHFVDVYCGVDIELTETGSSFFIGSTCYHPAFTALRTWLEVRGFLKTHQWHNGDKVLKPFIINDIYLDVGESFLSPAPLLRSLKEKKKDIDKNA